MCTAAFAVLFAIQDAADLKWLPVPQDLNSTLTLEFEERCEEEADGRRQVILSRIELKADKEIAARGGELSGTAAQAAWEFATDRCKSVVELHGGVFQPPNVGPPPQRQDRRRAIVCFAGIIAMAFIFGKSPDTGKALAFAGLTLVALPFVAGEILQGTLVHYIVHNQTTGRKTESHYIAVEVNDGVYATGHERR
jgi:hypothetical protein